MSPPPVRFADPATGRGADRRGEERQLHRRRAWRRVAGVLVAAAVATVIVLGALAPTVEDRAHALTGPGAARADHPPAESYALTPAPPGARISVGKIKGLRSGLLFDVPTGRILWAQDPGGVLPIASLTKMMTALVVIAHSRPGARVLITPQAVHFSGSGVGLLPLGKRVPLRALLYGLLLPSGNDAAIALAQHVAGTESRFVTMMNARAQSMGLGCTHFTTVSGLIDAGNHSCAEDLAVIAHAVLRQPLLAGIVRTRSAVLDFPIKGGKLYLYNNNPLLLSGYPGADGVKTGYTTAAGTCLVAAARRGRRWFGVVLLHSSDDTGQAEKLLDAAFALPGYGRAA